MKLIHTSWIIFLLIENSFAQNQKNIVNVELAQIAELIDTLGNKDKNNIFIQLKKRNGIDGASLFNNYKRAFGLGTHDDMQLLRKESKCM